MHNTSTNEQRAVRVNGQISEVKESIPRPILRWVPIRQPQFLQFGRNIRQICQLNRNIKNPQLPRMMTLPEFISSPQSESDEVSTILCL